MMGSRRPIPLTLYLAMLCQFAVGGAVIPFAGVLLSERGLSYAQVSQIFALSSSTLLVFPLLWGMIADRLIPIDRLFTILNLLSLAAFFVLYWQFDFGGLLIGFLMFYSFYHPTFTLINALCFHYMDVPEEQFGKVRAWGSVGWMVPSLMIYALLLWRPGMELGFILIVGSVAALAMMIVTLLLPRVTIESRAGFREAGGRENSRYWEAIGGLMRNGNYVVILISFFLISGSFSLLTYYSPPHLVSLGMARKWIGPVQCIGVVLEIIAFPFLPRLLGRFGYRVCLSAGALCLVARHLIFVFSSSLWLLALSYLLAAMMVVLFYIGASIMVNHLASRSVRASAQTILVLIGSGLGPLVTNGSVSLWLDAYPGDLRPVFLFAGVLAALAVVVIEWRGRRFRVGPEAAVVQEVREKGGDVSFPG